jgi:small subunit ribosomal protein S9
MEVSQTTNKKTNKTPKLKLDFKDSKYATGRRKTSIAKVWLKKGSGKIYVNGKDFQNYFSSDSHKMQIMRPFEIIEQATEYDVKSNVNGGGHTGQAGALVHGISKALLKFDSELKSTLRKEKLTTRDSRAVERKKPGRKKARRSYQFSKR